MTRRQPVAASAARRLAIGLLTVALAGLPAVGHGQVFLASKAHPEFAIGPLFIVAGIRPDLGPVTVRVSWSLALPPNTRPEDVQQDLYLLWPAEAVAGTGVVLGDAALRRYVEERGFAVVSEGRLALAIRDWTKLGTPAESDPLGESAAFVTFYKRGTNPAQSGIGTIIKVAWTPHLVDAHALLSLRMALKDLITPKPATWFEELFWGRRHVLNLSAGNVGSVALYSMYFGQRDRVLRFARDFSLLVAEFADADHLRIEEISPAGATRRPSRVRTGAETVLLPLAGAEGNVPQVLTVRFSYFSGWVAWRPILISLLFLVLGNLMGAWMFTQTVTQFFGRRFHLGRADARRPPSGAVLAREVLERIVPGETTPGEVLRLCGSPSEERARLRPDGQRTLIYRGTRPVPYRRFQLGSFAAVSRWDDEHHEVEIKFVDGRVSDVETRVRRSRPR